MWFIVPAIVNNESYWLYDMRVAGYTTLWRRYKIDLYFESYTTCLTFILSQPWYMYYKDRLKLALRLISSRMNLSIFPARGIINKSSCICWACCWCWCCSSSWQCSPCAGQFSPACWPGGCSWWCWQCWCSRSPGNLLSYPPAWTE